MGSDEYILEKVRNGNWLKEAYNREYGFAWISELNPLCDNSCGIIMESGLSSPYVLALTTARLLCLLCIVSLVAFVFVKGFP